MAPGGAVGACGGRDVISAGPFQVPEFSEWGGRHDARVSVWLWVVGDWSCKASANGDAGIQNVDNDVAEDGKSKGHRHQFTKQPLTISGYASFA